MRAGTGRESGAMLDEVVGRLQALIGEPQVSDAYVRFRLDLLAAQRAARRDLERTEAPPTPSGHAADPPALTADDVPFPAPLLGTLLQAIQRAAVAHGRETEDLRRLAAAAAADPDLPRLLAARAAFGPDMRELDSLARRFTVHPEALLFVGRALAAPCVAWAAAARWENGPPARRPSEPHRCPACGSPPGVARLRRADGRRIQTCGLCGSEWEAIRLACACCGTQEREALGVLRAGDADPRWVDTCDACQGYIKTVDERKLPEGETVLPIVEEAATLHLDLLAEREGFMRRVPYVLAG